MAQHTVVRDPKWIAAALGNGWYAKAVRTALRNPSRYNCPEALASVLATHNSKSAWTLKPSTADAVVEWLTNARRDKQVL